MKLVGWQRRGEGEVESDSGTGSDGDEGMGIRAVTGCGEGGAEQVQGGRG